jgi:multiple sugar transport system permease protein
MKQQNAVPEPAAAIALRPTARPRAGGTRDSFRRAIRAYGGGYLFILPAVLFLVALVVYPIILTFQLSTSTIKTDLSWNWIGLQNYVDLFHDKEFFNAAKTTGLFVVIMVISHLIVGMFIALLLSHDWPNAGLRSFLRGLLITPWLFSTAAAALMWSLMYQPLGMFNYMARAWFGVARPIEWLSSYPLVIASVALVGLWKSYPFYMVIILGGLQSIPVDLYEAAKVDGASFWQSFRSITLPLVRQVIVAISVIDIIGTVAMFDLTRLLTDGGPNNKTETIAYYLWKANFGNGRIDYASAMSIVILVSLLILIGIYMRLFARGGTGEGTSF